MLVAVAVFGLLVAMLAQLVGFSSQAITLNATTLDAAGQARLVLDRIGMDLAARPRRADLGALFSKATGNDSLTFYSEMTGYTGTRHVALIGYEIAPGATTQALELERGATGVDWAATGNPLVFTSQPLPTPASGDFEVLAADIFRLEFCYLLNTGVYSNSHSSNYGNVSALIVGVAALDGRSRGPLSASQIAQLSAALPDTTEGDVPLSDWNATMAQPTFAAGLPLPAVKNVRLYQRCFYVP